jgi:hypothetical protein
LRWFFKQSHFDQLRLVRLLRHHGTRLVEFRAMNVVLSAFNVSSNRITLCVLEPSELVNLVVQCGIIFNQRLPDLLLALVLVLSKLLQVALSSCVNYIKGTLLHLRLVQLVAH